MNPQIAVGRAAPAMAAVTAWVSLNPYCFWGSSRPLLIASILAGVAAALLFYTREVPTRWRRAELGGVLLLSVFLVYLTALPRVDGGHVKWVFVLPTLWLLALLDDEQRRRALTVFAGIFVATLVPGVIVSLLASGGFPLTFGIMPAANPLMAAHGTRMLVLPGALFFESNSVVLPWGGVLFRLCGMYDEPGMVGTIGALLLAAYRYRFRQWNVALLYLAGLLSFSLAFAVLTTCGLLARVAHQRRLLALAPLLPVLVAASLATGIWSFSAPPGTESVITVIERPHVPLKSNALDEVPQHKLVAGTELRQLEKLDNRSLPSMEALVSDYSAGNIRMWLFGAGSDASVVRGGVSQTWKRLFTDYGAIGLMLLATSLAFIAWARIRASRSAWVVVFVALFSLSIYQRPIVWMPYALLILLCGLVVAARAEETPATGVGARLRDRWREVPPAGVLLLLLAAGITLTTWAVGRFWPPATTGPVGVQRRPPTFTATPEATIAAAVQRLMWMEYEEYGTVRLGRVERPARLQTGRKQWVRELTVWSGRARFEAVVGARQSIAVDIEVGSGGVAAWGSEFVTVAQQPDNPPDVILTSLDTIRRDQLALYLPSVPATPALGAFPKLAPLFDQATATRS